MTFDKINQSPKLQGKPKGQKQILLDSVLWQDFCTDGTKILLKCPAKNNKSTSNKTGKCCSTALLQS